jgi:hypothetical protein
VPRLAWTTILLFYPSHLSWGDRHAPSYPAFSIKMGISQTVLPGLPKNKMMFPSQLPL